METVKNRFHGCWIAVSYHIYKQLADFFLCGHAGYGFLHPFNIFLFQVEGFFFQIYHVSFILS